MSKLHAEQFSDFFFELHGVKPFDWQLRLAKSASDGNWPDFVDLPTGSGKTACLDVAVFALAMSVEAKELAPRRIVMVVDRRVVVDQSHQRARRIAKGLREAERGSVSHIVATKLRQLCSSDEPLGAVLLRGAVPRDDNWSSRPDQPLIISSTVDQVGSRLLFRGYGVSPSMWPVHAGLVGTDCLYLLDEVHLARPYFDTLTALQNLSGVVHVPMHRFQVVSLSATPGNVGAAKVFSLSERDREGALAQRLHASKPAELITADLEMLPTVVAKQVVDLLDQGASSLLVVNNRVQRAVDCFKALRQTLEGRAEVRLLTGRMRAIDRDERVAEVIARVGSGKREEAPRMPLVVVSTQSIEAGADFDFDAVVTELASFDSLRQRFGRVDRLGASGKARGVIVEVREPTESGARTIPKDDPVYGGSLVACSKLLRALKPKKGSVDFGIEALNTALKSVEQELIDSAISEKPRAPALFPSYVDLWAHTRPAPDRRFTPDLGRFLHGPPSKPEVSIVWRADLDGVSDAAAIERIDTLPPVSIEAVSVPFVTATQWLRGSLAPAVFSDVEGRPDPIDVDAPMGQRRRAFRWTSSGAEVLTGKIKPGETVIVSVNEGGLFHGTFDGACTEPVSDRAEEAIRTTRGRIVMRLELRGVERLEDGSFAVPPGSNWVRRACDELEAQAQTPRFVELEGWTLAIGRKRVAVAEPTTESTTDDEVSPNTGVAVKLSRHSADVERWAKDFCTGLRLSESDAACVVFAAWLHDVGKADPRFQRLLRDGTEAGLRLAQREPDWLLAKSGLGPNDGEKAKIARDRSGYPKGARHEVLSAAMCDADHVRKAAASRGVLDFELLLHLVAAHHGWCRPFAPPVIDPSTDRLALRHGQLELRSPLATQLHRLEAGLADRFATLTHRYGWHRLAALEAVLRLADHRASEEEATEEENHANA